MKIAIYSDNFYPDITSMTAQISLSAKELAKLAHYILFVSPWYSSADYTRANLSKIFPTNGLPINVVRLPSIPFFGSPTGQGRICLPSGYGIALMKKFKPDIIHTHTPFGAGIEALLDAKTLGIPLVGTNHTPVREFMAYTPFKNAWATEKAIQYFSWYYNHVRYLPAPCEALIDEMRDFGFKKPASRLSNPIDLAHFTSVLNEEEKQSLKKRFNFSGYTILYTGRLAPEKHIDAIIEAVARLRPTLPDITLAITGHGSAEASLKTLVSKLGLEKQVRFLGFVDSESFPLVYKTSDLFVVMSTAESQCLSLMQAFATGLPAIGAKAWGLAEYITPQNGRLVAPGDIDGLADQIKTFAQDPALTKTLAAQALLSGAQCKPELVAETWERIYQESIVEYHHG